MIEISEFKEHEDGSATFSVEMNENEKEVFIEIGVRMTVLLAVFGVSESELLTILKEYKSKSA